LLKIDFVSKKCKSNERDCGISNNHNFKNRKSISTTFSAMLFGESAAPVEVLFVVLKLKRRGYGKT
jgi:hypothetical protein